MHQAMHTGPRTGAPGRGVHPSRSAFYHRLDYTNMKPANAGATSEVQQLIVVEQPNQPALLIEDG